MTYIHHAHGTLAAEQQQQQQQGSTGAWYQVLLLVHVPQIAGIRYVATVRINGFIVHSCRARRYAATAATRAASSEHHSSSIMHHGYQQVHDTEYMIYVTCDM